MTMVSEFYDPGNVYTMTQRVSLYLLTYKYYQMYKKYNNSVLLENTGFVVLGHDDYSCKYKIDFRSCVRFLYP